MKPRGRFTKRRQLGQGGCSKAVDKQAATDQGEEATTRRAGASIQPIHPGLYQLRSAAAPRCSGCAGADAAGGEDCTEEKQSVGAARTDNCIAPNKEVGRGLVCSQGSLMPQGI